MKRVCLAIAMLLFLVSPSIAATLCDPSYQNCRVPIIDLIDGEQVGIDVMTWFAEDYRYVAALSRAKNRGVRIRVIGNNRWSGARKTFLEGLKEYAIPTRVTRSAHPSHIKAMIFEGQGQLVFTGGNFTSNAMKPAVPYVNYTDEVVLFTGETSIVRSFMRIMDAFWANNEMLVNYAGHIDLSKQYPAYSVDPRLSVGWGNVTTTLKRVAARIDQETVGIDIVMYRLNDPYTRAALVRALNRGVPVRILTEPKSRTYTGQAAYEDALLEAGAKIKKRVHAGLTHEKLAIFHSDGTTLIPTNNWDVWNAVSAAFFTQDDEIYRAAVHHFNRKWNAPAEFR